MTETTMGGGREGFPETVWGTVLHSPGLSREALEQLCFRYWRPVYRFIRLSQRASIEDSKDLAQEFFCYLLEGDVVARYDREKGRFRHFLKGVLRNFLSTHRRDATRLKRGGGAWTLPLDTASLEESEEGNPEEAFDRQWAADVLNESIRELKAAGGPVWTVYESYYLTGDEASYDAVARATGLSVHQVKHTLEEARTRLEAIVRRRVRDSVTSGAELADEMNELFS